MTDDPSLNGIPIIVDPNLPEGTMFLLRLDPTHLRYFMRPTAPWTIERPDTGELLWKQKLLYSFELPAWRGILNGITDDAPPFDWQQYDFNQVAIFLVGLAWMIILGGFM